MTLSTIVIISDKFTSNSDINEFLLLFSNRIFTLNSCCDNALTYKSHHQKKKRENLIKNGDW